MRYVRGNEQGMALGLALLAIVLVGALVAGALFLGTQEQRLGENGRRVTQAFGVTEGGLFEVVRTWDPQAVNNRKVFPAETVHVADTTSSGGTGNYGGDIFKLNGNLYLVDLTGSDRASRLSPFSRRGAARQHIGLLARVRPVQFGIRAAVTTRGPVMVSGVSTVDGFVHNPPAWTNCSDLPDTAKAGMRHPDLSQIQGTGIVGNPAKLSDASVADSTFNKFGDVMYADLAARATIKLGPGSYRTQPSTNADGTCNTQDPMNWGDGVRTPPAPCAGHFPIVNIMGSATLNNVQGQGILLVDGDLDVQGSYQFFGVVVVKGALRVSGGGNTETHFMGAVLASNMSLNAVSGRTVIEYSKCAILSAIQNTGVVTPMRSRSWTQLY